MAEEAKKSPKAPLKAASSPAKTFREHILHRLPRYKGPYNVGYMDIEVPARSPRAVSEMKRHGKPMLRLDTVLMGLYYPCDVSADGKKPHRKGWMPQPRVATAKGYAKFLSAPAYQVTAYMACTTLFTKLPAYHNARLASRRPNEAEGEPPTFPIIIFSHGLGGSRLCYSAICGELASFGFIVAAVEHRDGSGARTIVNLPNNRRMSDIQSSTAIPWTQAEEQVSGPSYIVDYIFPKNNALDTAPHNEQGVDRVLRDAQISLRIEEIREAHHVLSMICQGEGDEIASRNLRPDSLEGVDWEDWKGRMHLNNVTAMGHSFGGATTVQLCRDDGHLWLSQGIIVDGWGLGTPAGGDKEDDTVTRPIITISSEAFMHWQENFDRIVGFCEEARSSGNLCWMLTIVGTTHLSFSDFGVLYPHMLSFLAKSITYPRRALYLTVTASLEFLDMTLPAEQVYRTWPDEGLLKCRAAERPLDALRPDHKPDDKWVAQRLKLPHETSTRIKAWARRWKRVYRRSAGQPGIGDYGGDEEIWMHYSSFEG